MPRRSMGSASFIGTLAHFGAMANGPEESIGEKYGIPTDSPLMIAPPPAKRSKAPIIITLFVIIAILLNFIPITQRFSGGKYLDKSDSSKLNYQTIYNKLKEDYTVENRTDPPGVYLTPHINTDYLASIYASNYTSLDVIQIMVNISRSNADIILTDYGLLKEEKVLRSIAKDICLKLNLSSDASNISIDGNDFDISPFLQLGLCCTSVGIFMAVIVYGVIYYRRK